MNKPKLVKVSDSEAKDILARRGELDIPHLFNAGNSLWVDPDELRAWRAGCRSPIHLLTQRENHEPRQIF
jgi:hypothetical protein